MVINSVVAKIFRVEHKLKANFDIGHMLPCRSVEKEIVIPARISASYSK